MPTSPLISVSELNNAQLSGKPLLIFDCSFDLSDYAKGRREYDREHIPGAVFADLHTNLSSPLESAASGGRHPLPQREFFADWLAKVGLSQDTLAVVYDRNRFNFCGRLWWMLRWVGHANVAVLDGGLQAWKASGGQITSEGQARAPGNFQLAPSLTSLVDADYVFTQLGQADHVLIDARAPERYRGQVEPIDRVAGHIPGAINRPFAANLRDDGTFKSPAELRSEFMQLLNGEGKNIIHYCGSGVSATPNVLAMELAGLGSSALYGGSWSDWSSRDGYPVNKVTV